MDAPESPAKGQLLLVDDSNMPRLMMANGLKASGWGVQECASGIEALRLLRRETFDAVVCDLSMPEMDGFEVLAKAKEADPTLPVVVMLDREDDSQTVIRAVREGAFDVVDKKGADRRHLLSAVEHAVAHGRMLRENIRLNLELEMRVAETEEQKQLILEETRKSERLLMSILPKPIAERLKGKNIRAFADSYPDVTVLFADITGFSRMAAERDAGALIDLLDEVFNLFDDLADRHGCEKIKTIGDAYMAAAGVPIPQMDHAQVIAELAVGMLQAVAPKIVSTGGDFNLRIGVHSGPVIAGVIGRKRPAFDLWGETVNIASRMEMHGVAGRIQVSDATHSLLERRYDFEPRGEIDIKGHQKMKTWFLLGRK